MNKMRKTKFWLIQIVMLVMVSLVFGSAAFAGPPEHSKGKKGAETSRMALTNHASGGNVHAIDAANENAAFYEASAPVDPVPDPEPEDDPTDCPEGTFYFEGFGCI